MKKRRKAPPQIRRTKWRKYDPIIFDQPASNATNARQLRAETSTGLDQYSGTWGEMQANHLLKRTLFGLKSSESLEFSTLGLQAAVSRILTPESDLAPPVNNYRAFVDEAEEYSPFLDVPAGSSWAKASEYWPVSFLRIYSLKGWWIKNMITQSTSIHQKLTLFWHTLLPVRYSDFEIAKLAYAYFDMLHSNAFGNYKTIIKRLTIDPAMLIFLNGYLNSKEAPDENYARELQELFTIGKGPNANFTEQDVYQAARVLTGWRIDEETIERGGALKVWFDEEEHDSGDKQFSSFYGNRVIQGRAEQEGSTETDDLIDMIFDNNEVAMYICRRLYNFFVYHEIDNNAEQNVIVPLAEIFRNNNYEIRPVLTALFQSEHFYDPTNMGAYIKSPAEHVLGSLRSMPVEFPDDLSEEFEFMGDLFEGIAETGMDIGDPPSVSGWQAYYQLPSYDKIWINTDTVGKRAGFQDYMIYELSDLIAFIETLQNPSDPNALISEVTTLLHGMPLSENTIADLKQNLLLGQQNDYYWTQAWNAYINEPDNEEYYSVVENRLASLFRPMLQLSEFQLF